ncbi:MAG: hypothetical protein R3F41_12085 [Gammaproteobacteria bacterium]
MQSHFLYRNSWRRFWTGMVVTVTTVVGAQATFLGIGSVQY